MQIFPIKSIRPLHAPRLFPKDTMQTHQQSLHTHARSIPPPHCVSLLAPLPNQEVQKEERGQKKRALQLQQATFPHPKVFKTSIIYHRYISIYMHIRKERKANKQTLAHFPGAQRARPWKQTRCVCTINLLPSMKLLSATTAHQKRKEKRRKSSSHGPSKRCGYRTDREDVNRPEKIVVVSCWMA